MEWKNKFRNRRRAPPPAASVDSAAPAPAASASTVRINVMYTEHAVPWLVPSRLTGGTIQAATQSPEFANAALGLCSPLLRGLGSVGISCLPNVDGLSVSSFVAQGGAVGLTPQSDPSTFSSVSDQAYEHQQLLGSDAYQKFLLHDLTGPTAAEPSSSVSTDEPFKNLEAEVARLSRLNIDLKKNVADLEEKGAEREKENGDLKEEVAELEEKNGDLEEFNRSLVAALGDLKGLYVRKLLEQFRRLVASKVESKLAEKGVLIEYSQYVGEPTRNWWNEHCCAPELLEALLEVTTMNFDQQTMQVTRYEQGSLQAEGGRAAHGSIPTAARMLYATIVCQFHGPKRDALVKIYRLVFNSDAETDSFR